MGYIDFSNLPAADEEPETARLRAGFSRLEWLAVAAARCDTLAGLDQPSHIAKVFLWIFGRPKPPPPLADARLETLRRAAVHAWHHAARLPDREDTAFRRAGFSAAHYELLRRSLAASMPRP